MSCHGLSLVGGVSQNETINRLNCKHNGQIDWRIRRQIFSVLDYGVKRNVVTLILMTKRKSKARKLGSTNEKNIKYQKIHIL